MSGTRRIFELMVLGVAAVMLSEAFLSLILEPEQSAIEGNPAWRLVLTITYLSVALVLLPWYRETLFVLRRNWSLVLLLVLAVLSSLWAEMPALVLRKCIGLFGATLVGIALAVRTPMQTQLRLLAWMFRIIAVLSLTFVLFQPSLGISKEGEWLGVFDYKNGLGAAMGLALLVESQLPAVGSLSRVLKGSAMLLYVVLLFEADSVTPLLAFVGAIALVNIYKFMAMRWRIPLYAFFLITGIFISIGVLFLVMNDDYVIGLLGRSSNLTGRTEIWGLVIFFILERPLLGYGYSGFWLGASPESFVVNRIMRGPIMYSHNGYLEILLTLGLIGLLLIFVLLGIGLKRAIDYSRRDHSTLPLWPLAFMFYFLIHNLGECTILVQYLEWPLCVSCIVGADPLVSAPNVEEEADLTYLAVGELT